MISSPLNDGPAFHMMIPIDDFRLSHVTTIFLDATRTFAYSLASICTFPPFFISK